MNKPIRYRFPTGLIPSKTLSLSLSLSLQLSHTSMHALAQALTHTQSSLSPSLSVPFSTSSSLDRLSRLFPVIFMSLRCMPAHIQRPNPLFLSFSLSLSLPSLLPLFTLFLSFHQASCQLYVSLLFSLRRCAIFELQLSHRRKSHPRSFSNAVEMQSEALIRFGRWTKFEMSIVDKAFA